MNYPYLKKPFNTAAGTMNKLKPWLFLTALLFISYACAPSSSVKKSPSNQQIAPKPLSTVEHPAPDPRVGLEPGLFDAGEAIWNLEKLSHNAPPKEFIGKTNSDLAFKDHYVIQGNYHGFIIWDVSNPKNPEVVVDYPCPVSQSDVSVYGDLLFVSAEGFDGRMDCGTQGIDKKVSEERVRGIRIFDISDIENPEYIHNVQTCRGSHTHSVLDSPNDDENIYVYVSGSAPVRSSEELPGCSSAPPSEDPNSALFRIEVIKVPLDNPTEAAIINSPRIFEDLKAAPDHGLSKADKEKLEEAKEQGKYVAHVWGRDRIVPDPIVQSLLKQIVKEREGSGQPTAADSARLRKNLDQMIDERFGERTEGEVNERGPNQCHDITLYPAIGLAGGACEGYGFLLDITDPTQPKRIDAVADSNFAYWHSATFNNPGTKVLFTDEWGGGGQPKCREQDPMEWGANAIFTIDEDNKMHFQSYYKLPAPQTELENCVAHNGSLIPVPDRDIMVQSWYQGGISVFDWTDPENPVEIAFHDRGPVDSTRMQMGGSWSVYWYNGRIYNSEIARGLDIFELKPSPYLTKNEIAAAKTVQLEQFNAQGKPMYEWPTTFTLARAYLDQLERGDGLGDQWINTTRQKLSEAENESGDTREEILTTLATAIERRAGSAGDKEKVNKLVDTLRGLANE